MTVWKYRQCKHNKIIKASALVHFPRTHSSEQYLNLYYLLLCINLLVFVKYIWCFSHKGAWKVYHTGSPLLTYCPEISIVQNCFTLLGSLSLFSLASHWSTLCYFLQISSQKFLFYPLNIHHNHHQLWFLWCILCFFLPSLAIQVSSWTCLCFFLSLMGGFS